MPSKNSRKQKEIAYRRKRIEELWAEGYNIQDEIADALQERYGIDVDRSTISRDLKAIQKQWTSATADAQKARILARLEWLWNEAREGWERSQKDKEVEVKEGVKGGSQGSSERAKIQQRRESQAGNPAFLRELRGVLEDYRKLYGFDKPAGLEISGPGGRDITLRVKYGDEGADDKASATSSEAD